MRSAKLSVTGDFSKDRSPGQGRDPLTIGRKQVRPLCFRSSAHRRYPRLGVRAASCAMRLKRDRPAPSGPVARVRSQPRPGICSLPTVSSSTFEAMKACSSDHEAPDHKPTDCVDADRQRAERQRTAGGRANRRCGRAIGPSNWCVRGPLHRCTPRHDKRSERCRRSLISYDASQKACKVRGGSQPPGMTGTSSCELYWPPACSTWWPRLTVSS